MATRTLHTLLNGSPTMSRLLSVTFHQEDSRWLPPSLATPPPSRSCSRGSPSSSLLCLEGKLSSIGTLVRAWTRWSSPRQSPT